MVLENRIEQLERQYRRMKVLTLAMALGLGLVVLSGARQDKRQSKFFESLKTKHLWLVDENDQVRASLGRTGLSLFGEKTHISLRTDSLPVRDLKLPPDVTHTGASIRLGLSHQLTAAKRTKEAVTGIRRVQAGKAGVQFDGISIDFGMGDAPKISLADAARNVRVEIDGTTPAIRIADKKGSYRAVLGRTATVSPKTGAETKYQESTLTLFDAKGTVVFQAPR